ncbi:uncharacterized protein LOC124678374 isoform X1 [Lolium rigidum]|uniref:uncharacterized protein LOC124678374 isoform X1 n=1 Tax=Lolium rigidum TaxID=89674 RepID=UPI001F5D4D17|nr:uncharacterized protein LOC124678374 isoform X1 [Lolium rigidum]
MAVVVLHAQLSPRGALLHGVLHGSFRCRRPSTTSPGTTPRAEDEKKPGAAMRPRTIRHRSVAANQQWAGRYRARHRGVQHSPHWRNCYKRSSGGRSKFRLWLGAGSRLQVFRLNPAELHLGIGNFCIGLSSPLSASCKDGTRMRFICFSSTRNPRISGGNCFGKILECILLLVHLHLSSVTHRASSC